MEVATRDVGNFSEFGQTSHGAPTKKAGILKNGKGHIASVSPGSMSLVAN